VDRYQRIGAHGEMISSDLHGAEEPIRWTLGWQKQDRVVTSPCTEKKKDALICTFWQRPSLWGSSPSRWDVDLDDQDATQGSLDDFWSMWQRVGLLWHVWQVAGAPGGATSCSVDDDYAPTGPTSPL
jgi:hypothetical protein